MLPTILIHLVFHSSTPGLTRFAPEVYAAQPRVRTDVLDFSHMPPPQSDWKALDVLCEEIVKNVGGGSKMAKAVELAVCFAMADVFTIGGKECEVGASDVPPVAHTHHILWAGIVGPSLGLYGIIYKVHDPVHLPLALVPGQGVHQEPVVQDHHDQVPMLDAKCLQKVAVLVGKDILIPHHLR